MKKPTRADQRLATRARLIDATFGCLVDHGYAGTTTALIARRADVSHGALFNHFGNKDELMAACVNEIFPRVLAEGTQNLLAIATGEENSLEGVVDVLWAQFSGPTMQAMRELMTAGRTNDSLNASISNLDTVVRNANARLGSMLLPELAGHPQLPGVIGLTVAAIDGAVFASQAFRDPTRHTATKAALVRALELLVADAAT